MISACSNSDCARPILRGNVRRGGGAKNPYPLQKSANGTAPPEGMVSLSRDPVFVHMRGFDRMAHPPNSYAQEPATSSVRK